MRGGASFLRCASASASTPARGGSTTIRSGVSCQRDRNASAVMLREAGDAPPLSFRLVSRSFAAARFDSTPITRSNCRVSGDGEKVRRPQTNPSASVPACLGDHRLTSGSTMKSVDLKKRKMPHAELRATHRVRQITRARRGEIYRRGDPESKSIPHSARLRATRRQSIPRSRSGARRKDSAAVFRRWNRRRPRFHRWPKGLCLRETICAQPRKRFRKTRRKNRAFGHGAEPGAAHFEISDARALRQRPPGWGRNFPLRPIAVAERRRGVRADRAGPLNASDAPQRLAQNFRFIANLRVVRNVLVLAASAASKVRARGRLRALARVLRRFPGARG